MRPTSLAVGSDPRSRSAQQTGKLAWMLTWVSILVSILALGIIVRGVATSGEFRSILSHQTLNPFVTILFAVMGAKVAARRPRNPTGWIFLATGLLFALTSLSTAAHDYGSTSSPGYGWAVWISAWIWIPALCLPIIYIPLLFPGGSPPSPRWRAVTWSTTLGLGLTVLAVMFQSGPFAPRNASPVLEAMTGAGTALLLISLAGSLAGFFTRFRRSAGVERQQMKWLAYALVLAVLSVPVSGVISILWPGSPWANELSIALSDLAILGIAAAATTAILRHGLYNIDLIINRTLVYSALTAGVVVLYALVVGALGAIFQAGSRLWVSPLATGLAAILIQPMRDRLQGAVNRLMYGERDEPYAVLSNLGRRLESSLPPEAILPTVVEIVAQTLKLPYVAIALKQENGFKAVASYGQARETLIELPLISQGETVGQLRLSTRSPNEPFTPGEERLLRDIARPIGAAAHSVRLSQDLHRLAADLQRSREELVKSREEERRRLRRDLHDELGPQLASLKLNLDVARNLVTRDPAAAEALLVDLRTQSQAAIADIRRLVFDLRPPALDELGLIGAIQEYTRQIVHPGLTIQVGAPEDMPPLPAAVEVAVYRITLEALANFVRHSQGTNCRVLLSRTDDYLQVEVCDDGLGLSGGIQPGVGLNSMRERAAELGGSCTIEPLPEGGTRVLARLPLA